MSYISVTGDHIVLSPAIGTSPFRVESGNVPQASAKFTIELNGDSPLNGVKSLTIEHPGGHIQHLVPMNPGQVGNVQSDVSGYGPGYFVFNASVFVDSITRAPIFDRILVLTHKPAPGTFPFTPELPTPCIESNQEIMLPNGEYAPIGTIEEGDLVMTLTGAQRVMHVTDHLITIENKKQRPILVSSGELSVIVSRQHRVVSGFNLVSAIHLHKSGSHLGFKTQILDIPSVRYINLWFEKHEIIIVNGLAVESGWLGGKRAPDLIGVIDWPKIEPYLENHREPFFPILKPE